MFNRIGVVLCLWCAATVGFAQELKKLALEEALKTAVERNLGIQLQKITVNGSAISLEETKARYEPVITSSSDFSTFDYEPTQSTQGSTGQTFTSDSRSFNSSLQKAENFGFSWSVNFNNSLSDTGSLLSFGDTYQSSLSFGFQQDLLNGFGLDKEILRNAEYVAQGDLKIAKHDMEIQIIDVLQQTENAYWDLVNAIEQLKVSRQSLALAKQLYEQNKVKIEVGTLAPIELVNNEANIADRELDIITGENNVRSAEDALKNVMNLPYEEWNKQISPTDRLEFQEFSQPNIQVDFETAMGNRPEVRRNMVQANNALLTRKLRKNELLPELTLSGSYSSGGTSAPDTESFLIDPDGDPEDPNNIGVRVIQRSSFDDALNKVTGVDFPGWNLGLELTWRPFNKQGKVNLARANVALRQREIEARQTQVDIFQDIRNAVRELESNLKAIRASERRVKFRQENLKAEEQKFQNGLSTNYLVSQAQNDLTDAESQVITAKVNYMKALVSYERAKGLLPKSRKITIK